MSPPQRSQRFLNNLSNMGREEFFKRYEAERQPCLIWTRVMGYMRNVDNFNAGKKSEFKERTFFNARKSLKGR